LHSQGLRNRLSNEELSPPKAAIAAAKDFTLLDALSISRFSSFTRSNRCPCGSVVVSDCRARILRVSELVTIAYCCFEDELCSRKAGG
jgi:hypothetical protein